MHKLRISNFEKKRLEKNYSLIFKDTFVTKSLAQGCFTQLVHDPLILTIRSNIHFILFNSVTLNMQLLSAKKTILNKL